MMNKKLDLLISKGENYSSDTFSFKFSIKNYDSTIALNALKVVLYGWIPYRTLSNTQITYLVKSIGIINQFNNVVDGTPQAGQIELNTSQAIYTVYHNGIDSSKISPNINLIVPSGSSQISPLSISNRTNYSFDIVLDSPVPTDGYSIAWSIPAGYDVYGGYQIIPDQPTITLTKIDPIVYSNNLVDTKIEITWPTSTTNLPNNYALVDCEVEVNDLQGLCDFDTWYSKLSNTQEDNSHVVLEQYNGSVWSVVTEYKDSMTVDGLTGIVPSLSNELIWNTNTISTPSTTFKSVYISKNGLNPLANNSSDKTSLSLWTSGTGDVRRALVRFDNASLPTNTSSSKRAILRLTTSSSIGISALSSINLYRVKKDWVENEVTYTKASNSVNWDSVGGDFDSAIIWNKYGVVDSSTFYVDFDVTDYVNYWISNPTNNFGVLVKVNDESNQTLKIELDGFRATYVPTIYGDYYTSSNPKPIITNLTPKTYIYDNTFVISAGTSITSGSVEEVDVFYIKDGVKTYLGGLTSGTNWSNTFTKTLTGDYTFQLVAYSDLDEIGYGAPFDITFIPNDYFQPSSVYYTSGTSGTISASIYQTERYKNQLVTITSGSNPFTQRSFVNGILTQPFTSNVSFSQTFSATISNYDGDGIDIETFDFSFYKQITNLSQGYAYVLLPDTSIGDAYFVPNTFTLSADVVCDVSTNVEYYNVDELGTLVELLGSSTTYPYTISASLTPSTISIGQSSYRYVNVFVNGLDSGIIKLYVKNKILPSITLLSDTCSNPMLLSGSFNDLDKTNTLINYGHLGFVLENGHAANGLGQVTVQTTSYGDNWSYTYNNPKTSSTIYEILAADNYGFTLHNSMLLPGVVQSGPFTNSVITSGFYTTGGVKLTSASNYTLSATTNIIDISQSYFIISDLEGSYTLHIPMSYNNTAPIALETNRAYSIKSYFKTNGGYENTSDDNYLIYEPGPSITFTIPNCESCYCSNSKLVVSGNYISTQNKDIYTNYAIDYITDSNIYDSNNNLIGVLSFDGPYYFNWNNPGLGATSIKLIMIVNGITYTIIKALPKQITQAPIIIITSPRWE